MTFDPAVVALFVSIAVAIAIGVYYRYGQNTKCPACQTMIPRKATVCAACGRDVT